eukprot:246589_1
MSLCFELLLALNFFVVIINSANIIIDTKLGKINGTVHKANSSKTQDVYSFYGIQYANTPIGDLRFRPSTVNASLWNGIYDGTRFGDQCVQGGVLPQSENCLFINIWTSKPNNTGTLLPVMFFIHGGGFYVGAGSNAEYNGINFVSTQKDFVYVSINYRLAALGFLSNKQIYDEDPNWKSYGGLNGVNDQITALKWVKNNIADYGGDPNQITIFGESAGGLSVCFLLLSPAVPNNIFQRAIIESGTCNGAWGPADLKDGLNGCNNALTKAGYPINNLTYLRSIDANTFINEVSCGVCVDDLVMTDQPKNIFPELSQNTFNAKDGVMIGWTSADALAQQFGGYAPSSSIEYSKSMAHYFPNTTQQNLMENVYYPPSIFLPDGKDNEYQMAWYTLNSDACLGCPALLMAQQILSSQMTNNVYIFEFGGPTSKSGTNYAPHASELPFVFDWKDYGKTVPWSQSLADSMVSAWTNFAIDGHPNVTNKIDKINIIWKPFPFMMVFNDTGKVISSQSDYRNGGCHFLNYNKGFSVEAICNNGAK